MYKGTMRPPKEIPKLSYRAFHPGYETMYKIKSLHLQSGFVSLQVPDYLEDEYFYDEVFIMQSTGTVDKDDVESFEKDIIEFINDKNGILTRHIIRAVDHLFEDGIVIEGILIHFKDGYKVLGNVYQHEEVLKEKCQWTKLGIVL